MSDQPNHAQQGVGHAGTGPLDVGAMTPEQVDGELARQDRDDPDGMLISDFLAGDLDDVRQRAVQRRLETDPDFARRAEPYYLMRALMRDGDGGDGPGARAAMGGDAPAAREAPRRELHERFRIAAIVTFLVGGAMGGWIGYRLVPAVTPGIAFGATGIEHTDGQALRRSRTVVDSVFSVELAPDSRLAYSDVGRRSTFPDPPGQHEIQLDGGGAFELMLPTARELSIRTPFITVRGQRARFRIQLHPPCTTTVSVSEGEIVLKRRFVADSGNPMVFAGKSVRVECDQSLTPLPDVVEEGETPVQVDSTILPSRR